MIVFVTTADTEILALSRVAHDLPDGFPTLKAVNPTRLPHELAPETLAAGASLVLVRLLGGCRAWQAGFDGLAAFCRRTGVPFLAWAGEPHADAELTASSTAPAAIVGEAFEYLCHGGVDNLKQLLLFLSDTLLMTGYGFEPPQPLPEYGIYHPAFAEPVALADYLQQRWQARRPAIGVLFYRVHCLSGNTDFIDALIAEVEHQGGNVLPIFCAGLRLAGGPPPAFQTLLLDDQDQPRVDCLVSALCALFYADICQEPEPVCDAEGVTMDIPGLVQHQIRWLKRSCHTRQQRPADLRDPLDEPERPQAPIPAPAALQFAHALRRLMQDASGAHQLHRVACIRIVRALLADVLASVFFTTLGYTLEEAELAVEEHIAPALATYLTTHGPRLARSRGHEPSG